MIVDSNRAQRLFACLGDPSRFRVVTVLSASECCVTDLARAIGLSQSCTTRHLQALQREGLVVGLRRGKRVVFRLNTEEPMIAGLVAWVSSHEAAGDGHETRSALGLAGETTRDAHRTPNESPARSRVDSRPGKAPGGVTPRREIEDFLL